MPELRKDLVTGSWVIIAAERSKRPNDFSFSREEKKGGDCVFCYGNEDKTPPEVLAVRPQGGEPNEPGWVIRAFPNKFPAVASGGTVPAGENVNVMDAVGKHEVIVDCQEHSDSFGELNDSFAEQVMVAVAKRYVALSKDETVKYIQVFKNSGAAAGASIEHSHWQIISIPIIPETFNKEYTGVKKYLEQNGRCVYCKITDDEIANKSRIIEITDDYAVFCPFASRFPFETWILPRKHEADFGNLSIRELKSLGRILRRSVRRLEIAFGHPPYNIVVHTSPPIKGFEIFHWHIEIIPRLSAIAGFELGTGVYINSSSPEMAASVLSNIEPNRDNP